MQCHMLLRQSIDVGTGRSLNVAYLYGAYEDSKNVMLVMELCKGGEMWNRVSSGRYSEKGASCHVPAQSFARPLCQSMCLLLLCCAFKLCFHCMQTWLLVRAQEADRFSTLDCPVHSLHSNVGVT